MEIASCVAPRRKARPPGRVDRALLRSLEHSAKWLNAVKSHVAALSGTGSKLAVLETAMVAAAKEGLLDDGRRRPGWFIAAQARLMPLITKRNEATRAQSRARTPETKGALKLARKAVKREVDEAKATWVRRTIEIIQPEGDARPPTPKVVWEAIFLLKRGPGARKAVAPLAFYEDQTAGSGPKCEESEGNRRVMVEELKKVFSQTGTFDPEAIANVRQRPQQP